MLNAGQFPVCVTVLNKAPIEKKREGENQIYHPAAQVRMQLLILNKDIINNSRVWSLGLITFQEKKMFAIIIIIKINLYLPNLPPHTHYIWLATIMALTGMFLDSVKHCTSKKLQRKRARRELRAAQYFTFVTHKKNPSCANIKPISHTHKKKILMS